MNDRPSNNDHDREQDHLAHRRSDGRSFARTSTRISALAGLSVLSGFVIDAAMAARFGAGGDTDSFFIAAAVPLTIGNVLLASANQAVVPVISRWLKGGSTKESADHIGGLLGAVLIVGLSILSAGVVISPVLPGIIAPGSPEEVRKLAVSISLVLFVTVATRAVTEVLRATLNAASSFMAAAGSPLVNNLTALIVALFLSQRLGILAFALGYVVGGVAQTVFLLAAVIRSGIRMRLGVGMRDPAVRATFRLLVLPTAATGLNAAARIAERFLASFMPVGSITIINYAWRVTGGIGGTVFFRSVTVQLIPRLAREWDDDRASSRILRDGWRVMAGISLPLAALFIALAEPLTALIFQRGAFSVESVRLLASVVAIYALTFPSAGLGRAQLSLFYGRLDMLVPFLNRLLVTVATIAGAWALSSWLGVRGIAWGYVAASFAGLVHSHLAVRRRIPFRLGSTRSLTGKLLISSVVAAAVSRLVSDLLPSPAALLSRALYLAFAGLLGLSVLSALLVLFRVRGLRALLPSVTGRTRGPHR